MKVNKPRDGFEHKQRVLLEQAVYIEESEFRAFLATNPSGLSFVPQSPGYGESLALYASFGDFAKWASTAHPDIRIDVPKDTPRAVLRSGEIWLPLAHLAGDLSVQLFLNMVANYLYDLAKGALKNDRQVVHFSAIFENNSATKRLEFSGDAEGLERVIKRFDPNKFFDEAP